MEFPSLGQQCSLSACNQIDFLPFKCVHCCNLYCVVHASPNLHNCPSAIASERNQCPHCKILLPSDLEGDLIKHLENECKSYLKTNSNEKDQSICASGLGCVIKSASLASKCRACKLTFCLQHRHYADHNCKGIEAAPSTLTKNRNEANEQVELVKQKLDQKWESKSKSKSSPQLEFMRLKTKAKGDSSIPIERRYFFKVYESSIEDKSVPSALVFVKKDWSMGKCLDQIIKQLSQGKEGPSYSKISSLQSPSISFDLAIGIDKLLELGQLSKTGWDEIVLS